MSVGLQELRTHELNAALERVLDVHFTSSLPVVQRIVCKAWADTRPVQIAWAESSTMPDHDVVDDECD